VARFRGSVGTAVAVEAQKRACKEEKNKQIKKKWQLERTSLSLYLWSKLKTKDRRLPISLLGYISIQCQLFPAAK
jgi:hypothetical protein